MMMNKSVSGGGGLVATKKQEVGGTPPNEFNPSLVAKVLVPAFASALVYGAVPLYAVFLTYAAFYPAVSVAIEFFEAKKQASGEQDKQNTFELNSTQITSLVIAGLVVVLVASATLLPSLAFLTAYLPAVIAAFAGFEFVVAALPFFKTLVSLYKANKSIAEHNAIILKMEEAQANEAQANEAQAKSGDAANADAEAAANADAEAAANADAEAAAAKAAADEAWQEAALAVQEAALAVQKSGFYLISTVIAMTAVMFGAGLLVEANFVLAAATIAVVGILSVVAFQAGYLDELQGRVQYFFRIFFNPIATIALASVFGLSGFGFLPALALTNPVFAAIWAIAIVAISYGIEDSIKSADFKQLGWLVTAGLGYIAASLVVNPGVGFVAALGLGVASPVVWAAMIASPVVSVMTFKALSSAVATVKGVNFSGLLKVIKATFTVENVVNFAKESWGALAFSSLVKPVKPVEFRELQLVDSREQTSDSEAAVVASDSDSDAKQPLETTECVQEEASAQEEVEVLTQQGPSYDRADQVKAIVNSLIWSVLVYGVASYIMAPAGTMFVAMLGANVAIALPLALAVYAIAAAVVAFDLFNAKATRTDTVKAFNVSDLNKKVGIVLLSLLTLSVGPVLAFSGIAMFEIFAATSVMQALTVATSVIVAATVWRTLDKALSNAKKKEENKDSWGKIALKALGVIFFAAVGYSLAAILPMFAGLVLPTWSALASGFSSLSMTGAFVATIVMSYFINVATYYAKGEYNLVNQHEFIGSAEDVFVNDEEELGADTKEVKDAADTSLGQTVFTARPLLPSGSRRKSSSSVNDEDVTVDVKEGAVTQVQNDGSVSLLG